MSYDQYKQLLGKMSTEELNKEIAMLQQKVKEAKTAGTRNAWRQMLTSAHMQQKANENRVMP
jgi:hypothetical protein